MGEAGGFGRAFFETADFLAVVFLPDPSDRVDGEESTVLTKRTSINSRIIGISTVCLIGAAAGLPWRSRRFCGGLAGGWIPGFTLNPVLEHDHVLVFPQVIALPALLDAGSDFIGKSDRFIQLS